MNKSTINVTRSSLPSFAEYCNEIKDLWDTHWLTNMGAKHEQLEAELKAYLATPNVTLYTNGHLALENAIEAMGLTGEIITTPFTFASTTHAIVRSGCLPVFCDIDSENYTMNPDLIESLITEKTSCILPVHVYGNLCDVDAIQKIAERYKLKVIFDAAHAFGVSSNGVSSANFGDISMFSFHATKVFHTIEGGALTYHDNTLYQKLNDIKNFGIHNPDEVEYVGGNAKMSETQAAMGICNLRHLKTEIEKRKSVSDHYRERLDGVKGLRLNNEHPKIKQNYAYFPVLFDGYRYSRDYILDRLKKDDIFARKYFYPLTNCFECYSGRQGFTALTTPVAKYMADRVLTLPLYADLPLCDVDRICNIVLE